MKTSMPFSNSKERMNCSVSLPAVPLPIAIASIAKRFTNPLISSPALRSSRCGS
jgi:hypothetical protein